MHILIATSETRCASLVLCIAQERGDTLRARLGERRFCCSRETQQRLEKHGRARNRQRSLAEFAPLSFVIKICLPSPIVAMRMIVNDGA